jgi:hypothetical protein
MGLELPGIVVTLRYLWLQELCPGGNFMVIVDVIVYLSIIPQPPGLDSELPLYLSQCNFLRGPHVSLSHRSARQGLMKIKNALARPLGTLSLAWR